MDEVFSKSRVVNTELFALDVDLVVQVYLETLSKEEMFLMRQQKNDR